MWVPVVSLVWTIVYLMQSRLAPLRIKDNDSDDENKTNSRKLKGESFYYIEEMVKAVPAYPRGRINYNSGGGKAKALVRGFHTQIVIIRSTILWTGRLGTATKTVSCVSMAYFWRRLLGKWTTWPQWLAITEVALLGLALGMCGGWTSPYVAKLTSPDSELPVTETEASWIASLLQLGRVVGAVVGSASVAYVGSKMSVLITGIPVALSWVFLIIANSVEWIYAARALQGISTGMFFGTFPLYAGEIAHPSIRGAIIGFIMNSQAAGFLFGNLVGTLTSMWLFSAISLVLTIAFLAVFTFLPDSPHNLVACNKFDKAAKAIAWYQRDADVPAEMESLKKFIQSKRSTTFRDILAELNIPRNRKALIMTNIVFILLQVGGTYSMSYYMETILRRAGVSTVINPGMAVVSASVIGITGGILAMYANDKFGRKIVLGGAATGVMVCLVALGIHFVLIEQGYGTPSLEWLPVIILIAFEFFTCLGIGPVPSTIVSEIFPPRTKSIAACTANAMSGLFAFISTKTYQPMIDVMPDQYVFWFYAIVMGILAVYTFIKLPETKGKTLQEIQDMLKK